MGCKTARYYHAQRRRQRWLCAGVRGECREGGGGGGELRLLTARSRLWASRSMVDLKAQMWQASRPVNSQAILCTRATAGSAMSTKEQAQCPTCAASVQELPTKATCGVTRGSASPGSPLTTQSNAPYFGSYEYCCCSLWCINRCVLLWTGRITTCHLCCLAQQPQVRQEGRLNRSIMCSHDANTCTPNPLQCPTFFVGGFTEKPTDKSSVSVSFFSSFFNDSKSTDIFGVRTKTDRIIFHFRFTTMARCRWVARNLLMWRTHTRGRGDAVFTCSWTTDNMTTGGIIFIDTIRSPFGFPCTAVRSRYNAMHVQLEYQVLEVCQRKRTSCSYKNWKTSAVSATDWMIETQLCKLRGTWHVRWTCLFYISFTIRCLWTKPRTWLLILIFTKFTEGRSRVFYLLFSVVCKKSSSLYRITEFYLG